MTRNVTCCRLEPSLRFCPISQTCASSCYHVPFLPPSPPAPPLKLHRRILLLRDCCLSSVPTVTNAPHPPKPQPDWVGLAFHGPFNIHLSLPPRPLEIQLGGFIGGSLWEGAPDKSGHQPPGNPFSAAIATITITSSFTYLRSRAASECLLSSVADVQRVHKEFRGDSAPKFCDVGVVY